MCLIESEEIPSTAVALGIDYLQGYMMGKPAPLVTLAEESAEGGSGRHFRSLFFFDF
ncbi:hypothetical protein [Kosakonia arachidis]|uniref:hypothetical protein n=1 Tax=Kosakonia arachidis TaxID=551989 RepID=UPI00142EE231|nr:hypothetical protein [Kosakonia arachidis]